MVNKKKRKNSGQPAKPTLMGKEGDGERFILEKRLGAGGICQVYEATDLRRMEYGDAAPKIALKCLLPEFVDNPHARLALVQEFLTLRHITAPGVVRVFDLHATSGGPCFSMELLSGHTAREWLHHHNNGSGKTGIKKAAQLLDSLSYMHRLGIVHGDIKPANIFLAQGDRTVLFDFNIARVNAPPGNASTALAQGLRRKLKLSAQSMLYASPERLQGSGLSAADDIFALSCTVYEFISGQHPFNRQPANQYAGMQPGRPPNMKWTHWYWLKRGLSFTAALRPSAVSMQKAFAADKGFMRLFYIFGHALDKILRRWSRVKTPKPNRRK
ncbi:MAG: serine/threonine protein kinase [Desulfarculales bacterium]|jgi:serine/threonine-protein kinase Stk1|nr:serine/threonine protein kinase [Desulfarculales bacterium]